MAALPESSAADALALEPAAIESQPGQVAADPQPMPVHADATAAVQTDSAIALSAAGVSPDSADAPAVEATVEPAVATDALATRGIDLDPMSLDYALAQIDPSKAPPAGAST
ncbi:hypothetical protein AB4084_03630, partial [Lysobacter sp. 2RAB21]